MCRQQKADAVTVKASMQFLADIIVRAEVYTPEQLQLLMEPEAQAVRKLYTDGMIRAAWSRDDVLGAFLMFEAPSVDAVDAALQLLPVIKCGMAEAQIIPVHGYRGFGPTQF